MWIEINNKNSKNEFMDNLVITSVDVTPPQVKTYKVDIPYSSNNIDLNPNKADLGPLYIEVGLNICPGDTESLYDVLSRVLNWFTVSKSKIKISGYDDYYFIGSCVEIGTFEDLKVCGNITFKLECEPWKYKDFKLNLTGINAGNEFIIKGSKMASFPIVEVNKDCSIMENAKTYTLKTGINYIYDLELYRENHIVRLVTGSNVNLKISYRRGFL